MRKWTYETVKEEARKYASRNEFNKGAIGAYKVALKNGWLDNYTWFSPSKTSKKWNYETCKEEASKYQSRKEFETNNQSAYKVARKNKWLDEFSDLFGYKKQFRWIYNNCFEEAKKYTSRKEFSDKNVSAYEAARKNGWLDDYNWLTLKCKPNNYWNYETVTEESKKYTSRVEFKKCASGAHKVALKNGWLDDYTWLKDERFDLFKDPIDCVYAYEFSDYNCVYVGRTLIRRKNERDKEHIYQIDNDTVAMFANEKGISVPIPKYLEENLTLEEGSKREGYWLQWYKDNGWETLNIAKTGSIGRLGKGKWTYKTVKEESKKYTSRSEFKKVNNSAYEAARKNGWLDDYNWLTLKCKPNGYWNYKTCKEEARKYRSRSEFVKGARGAYKVALKNGWLDEFFGKPLLKYWPYVNCKEEAKLYSSRNEFSIKNTSAYAAARRNGWLDEFFPKYATIKINK